MALLPSDIRTEVFAGAPSAYREVGQPRENITGRFKITFSPVEDLAENLQIIKNSVVQAENFRGSEWVDPNWSLDALYQLKVTDNESSIETPVLPFPYYPVAAVDGAHYYNQSWQLAQDALATFAAGTDNPIRIIKTTIRREIELQMLNGGLFQGKLARTNADIFDLADIMLDKLPTISISASNNPIISMTNATDVETIGIDIQIFGYSLDKGQVLRDVEDATYWLAWFAKRQMDWGAPISGIYNTTEVQATYPSQSAIETLTDAFQVIGRVRFNIQLATDWRM